MVLLSKHKHGILLGIVLILVLVLRLWGVWFGLPYVGFQPDEWFIADEGLELLQEGFAPSRLGIGTLHAYIQAGITWPVFRLIAFDPDRILTYREMLAAEGINTGVVGIPHPLPAYYLWGRMGVAVMGMISVWLTYLIGREIESSDLGLLGALFLAASPLHAEYSHYLIRTIPGLMFLLLAFYVILLAYQRERWWLYGLGSVLVVSAILTKQNNLVILVPFGLSLVLSLWRTLRQRSPKESLKVFGAILLAAGTGSLALTLILRYRDPIALVSSLIRLILNNPYVYGGHHFGYGGENTLLWVFNYFLHDPWRFVFLLALPGVGVAALELRERGWLLLSIPVSYLLVMSFFTVRFIHWLVPVLPFLGILAGLFLIWGVRYFAQQLRRWSVPWYGLMAVGALAITITSFKLIIIQDYWLSQKDVRVVASEWLQVSIPRGMKVVIERYGPYLSERSGQVEYVASAAQKGIEAYRAEGVDYLVINESQYRLTQSEAANPKGDPAAKEYMARYQAMSEELPLVQEFTGPTIVYPRRWVRVYGLDSKQ